MVEFLQKIHSKSLPILQKSEKKRAISCSCFQVSIWMLFLCKNMLPLELQHMSILSLIFMSSLSINPHSSKISLKLAYLNTENIQNKLVLQISIITDKFYIYLLFLISNCIIQLKRMGQIGSQAHAESIKKENYVLTYSSKHYKSEVILKKPELIKLFQKTTTLPNFLFYQNTKSKKRNFYKSAIIGMIEKEVNEEQILGYFQQIPGLNKLNPNMQSIADIGRPMDILKEVDSDILCSYTKDDYFHKSLNSILRWADDMTEIFYVQPFVKKMHQKIRQKYSKSTLRKFICFRGGRIQQKEKEEFIKNKGKYIESLGFLSTSRSEKKARNFLGNLLVTIKVDQIDQIDQNDQIGKPKSQYVDQGYAYIDSSVYREQEEVLFNVLSSFLIEDAYHDQQQIFHVHLKYGQGTNIQRNILNTINHQSLSKAQPNPFSIWINLFIQLITQQSLNKGQLNPNSIQINIFIQLISKSNNQIFAILQDWKKPHHVLCCLLILEENMDKYPQSFFPQLQLIQCIVSFYIFMGKFDEASNLMERKKIKYLLKEYEQKLTIQDNVVIYAVLVGTVTFFDYFTGRYQSCIQVADKAKVLLTKAETIIPQLKQFDNYLYRIHFVVICLARIFSLFAIGQVISSQKQFNSLYAGLVKNYQFVPQSFVLNILHRILFDKSISNEQSIINSENFSDSIVSFIISEMIINPIRKIAVIHKKFRAFRSVLLNQNTQTTRKIISLDCQKIVNSMKDEVLQSLLFLCITKIGPIHILCSEHKEQVLAQYEKLLQEKNLQKYNPEMYILALRNCQYEFAQKEKQLMLISISTLRIEGRYEECADICSRLIENGNLIQQTVNQIWEFLL